MITEKKVKNKQIKNKIRKKNGKYLREPINEPSNVDFIFYRVKHVMSYYNCGSPRVPDDTSPLILHTPSKKKNY